MHARVHKLAAAATSQSQLKSVPTLVLVSVFATLCGSGRRLLFLLCLLLPVLLVVVVLEEEQREHPQDAADADADGFALRTGSEEGNVYFSPERWHIPLLLHFEENIE